VTPTETPAQGGLLSLALGKLTDAQIMAEKLALHAGNVHGPESRDARASSRIVSSLTDATGLLKRAGVERVETAAAAGFDLSQLAETFAGRGEAYELIAGLRSLLPVAEALDRARGRVVDESLCGPGETPGTDTAELLQGLLFRLENETGGARGKGLE
jgi:hypothetical protein